MKTLTYQHDTLDSALYRATGKTTTLDEFITLNEHALASAVLSENIILTLPNAPAREKPKETIALWGTP